MPLMCSELAGRIRRIVIGDGSSEYGARLGGRSPDGVTPTEPALRYVATFPLSADGTEEASLFVSPDPSFVFGGNMGRILRGSGIGVVRHTKSRRGSGSPFDSPMSEHPLVLADRDEDETVEEGVAVPYSGHKIGGRPYFVHGEPELEDEVNALLGDGFWQCIQLDFPGGDGDAAVSGPWPFGTGVVHVLCRLDGAFQWCAFWED